MFDKKLKLNKVGEYRLLDYITRYCLKKRHLLYPTIVKIGDDAAVVKIKNFYLVFTTDLFIEDIHFKKKWSKSVGGINRLFFYLANKTLAANISDLSAMGTVKPLYCLIGLGLPSNLKIENIKSFYNGLENFCKKYNIEIIGGDTNLSSKIFISITLIGIAYSKKNIVLRKNAKIGDKIYITGCTGDAAKGVEILNNKFKNVNSKIKNWFIKKFFFPEVKLEQSQKISKYANSMIDCSDGLVNSINIICKQSNVGAKIYLDKVPVSDNLKKFNNYLDYVLYGGEDYELIFTSNCNLKNIIPDIFEIGEIVQKNKKIKLFFYNDEIKIKNRLLFDHFKS